MPPLPSIRPEVLAFPKIMAIFIDQLTSSIGFDAQDYAGHPHYMSIASDLLKLAMDKQNPGHHQHLDEIRKRIASSLASIFETNPPCPQYLPWGRSVVHEYIALFYSDERGNSIENTYLRDHSFPTTERIINSLLKLYVSSTDSETKAAVNLMIRQASSRNDYIAKISTDLITRYITDGSLKKADWEAFGKPLEPLLEKEPSVQPKQTFFQDRSEEKQLSVPSDKSPDEMLLQAYRR